MQATTIGLDIAKNLFQVDGVDARGRVVLRKRLARAKVLIFFANLPRCVIGLEACGGAHYWARELRALGHDARLMPPQYVKAYVKTNKHDAADAEACCEAVQRPSMRFVPVKTAAEQAILMLHRVRDQLIGQRTATINALRGHLTELGIVAAKRQAGVRQLLTLIGEVEDDRIPPLAREMLQTLAAHLRDLESKIAGLDRRLVALVRTDPICRALAEVPGVGPVIATAFAATVPDAAAFRSGRHLAAWLGLVPAQHSSGGQDRPRGLSKRGDGYLRRQLIHGARGAGVAQSGPDHRPAVGVDPRPAGAPAVQRRGRCRRQQAGTHPLGAAPARRGLSRRGVEPARRQNRPLSCEGKRRGDGISVGPRPAEPVWVHELRARSHDRELVRGSHQGRRPEGPRSQAEWMAAAKTATPSLNKALARREASMDGPPAIIVNGQLLRLG
jgi:transposase